MANGLKALNEISSRLFNRRSHLRWIPTLLFFALFNSGVVAIGLIADAAVLPLDAFPRLLAKVISLLDFIVGSWRNLREEISGAMGAPLKAGQLTSGPRLRVHARLRAAFEYRIEA